MDNSTLPQLTDEALFSIDASMPAQDLQPLDTAVWCHTIPGSVDAALSPTQSYACQSGAPSLSFPGAEYYVLDPLGPNCPSYQKAYGSVLSVNPDMSSFVNPETAYHHPQDQAGTPLGCHGSTDIESFPGSFPLSYHRTGQVSHAQSHYVPVNVPPGRTLLPRTELSDTAGQPTYGSQRTLRPQAPGTHLSPAIPSPVNSATAWSEISIGNAVPAAFSFNPEFYSTTGGSALAVGCVVDPGAEEFSTLIRFDHDDQATAEYNLCSASKHDVAHPGSSRHGYQALPEKQARSPTVPERLRPKSEQRPLRAVDSGPENVSKARTDSSSTLTGEGDEGRHRNHPLYSKPPDKDGMYRCPYKDDPSCTHKDTKLKCNYDKYIDSHLKPFRCKASECSKQHFSSTACLLRHEREAHGMHGHGDRPHLCYYAGCERGDHGNGFPRRYNLFDHMKRVHDYREDAVDHTGSPILGGETQKKIKGASKRKASSSPVNDQPAQRQKGIVSQQQQPLIVPLAPEGYFYPGYFGQH